MSLGFPSHTLAERSEAKNPNRCPQIRKPTNFGAFWSILEIPFDLKLEDIRSISGRKELLIESSICSVSESRSIIQHVLCYFIPNSNSISGRKRESVFWKVAESDQQLHGKDGPVQGRLRRKHSDPSESFIPASNKVNV